MSALTVRNLDDDVKRRLRIRAAENGRSMEAEARAILHDALFDRPTKGLGSRIHAHFADIGGVELELPPRTIDGSDRRVPDFDGPDFAADDRP